MQKYFVKFFARVSIKYNVHFYNSFPLQPFFFLQNHPFQAFQKHKIAMSAGGLGALADASTKNASFF